MSDTDEPAETWASPPASRAKLEEQPRLAILSVLVPLVCMLLGEVVFGGLGAGVYSIIMPALLGVFLGGLMIGRTPEYLGKKITSAETRWIALSLALGPIVEFLHH